MQESRQHTIWDMYIMFLAEFILFFKIVGELPESIEINLTLSHDGIDDLCLLLEEVLEGTILSNITALFTAHGIFQFLKVLKIVWDFMHWNVVDEKTLSEIIVRNMIR